MHFIDLNHLTSGAVLETDLCVVGTGPAGASIALEFEGTGIDVLMVESGGFNYEVDTQSCYDIESTGAQRELRQNDLRRRVLGGSSRIWSGRCAPFSEIDFSKRSWIPHSGWPFSLDELRPYLGRATQRLRLGADCFDERLWHYFKTRLPFPPLDRRFLEPMFWQFSKSLSHLDTPVNFASDLMRSKAANLRVLLHANVTQINTNPEGTSIASLGVSSLRRRHAKIRARCLVLACGAIENARLLLASNRLIREGLGNGNDMVGRFLMDHTTCVLGNFSPNDSDPIRDRFGHYWLDDGPRRTSVLHGLALSKETQSREQLLNCHAYVEGYDVAEDDPWSAMRRLRPAVLSTQFATASGNLLKTAGHFGEVLGGIYRRQIRHRPELVRFKRVELQCILEQIPDPDSRITLAEGSVDALGMPLSSIHWKISQLERRTARRMREIIFVELRRLGLPVPQPTPGLDDDNGEAHFFERAHPAGSTRMSSDPKRGVVDQNCQVHGIDGLFLAGSSVFPTSGAANPTLMIVAMALRLADWLRQHFFSSSAIEPTSISVPGSHDESRITAPTSVPIRHRRIRVNAFQKSSLR